MAVHLDIQPDKSDSFVLKISNICNGTINLLPKAETKHSVIIHVKMLSLFYQNK